MTHTEIRLALMTMPSRVVLALTVYGEARGESSEGQIAVAWIVKNRAAAWRMTMQSVCFQKNQFSCWWGDDANTTALFAQAERVCNGATGAGDPAWLETSALVHRVLSGAIPDPTHGATFYCTAALLEDPAHTREWFPTAVRVGKLVKVAQVGHHVFFAEAA